MHRIVRSNRIIKKTSRFLRRSSKFETEKNASREKIRDVSARRWKGASKSRDEIRLWWWWREEGGIYEPQLHALWRESKEEGGLGNLVDDLGEEVDCDIRRSSKSIHRNIRARFLKSCGLKTPRVTTPFRLHRSSDYTRINKCSRCSPRFVSMGFEWITGGGKQDRCVGNIYFDEKSISWFNLNEMFKEERLGWKFIRKE